jgi:hypothetical protein
MGRSLVFDLDRATDSGSDLCDFPNLLKKSNSQSYQQFTNYLHV